VHYNGLTCVLLAATNSITLPVRLALLEAAAPQGIVITSERRERFAGGRWAGDWKWSITARRF